MLEKLRGTKASKLLLAWEGSKVPRGLEMPNGGKIAWTQHGIVSGQNGEKLGLYQRIEEWGGPNQNRHKMIISL